MAALSLAPFLRIVSSRAGRTPPRVLGVDPGSSKTGFALCALNGAAAEITGLGVARAPHAAPSVRAAHFAGVVHALAASHGAHGVVVGWPLDPRGLAGPECASALAIIDAMRLGAGASPLPVLLLDERNSSAEARLGLRSEWGAGRVRGGAASRAPRAHVDARVDEAAAIVILERFLALAGGEP